MNIRILSLSLITPLMLVPSSYAQEISTAKAAQEAYTKCLSENGDISKVYAAVDDLPSDELSKLYKTVNNAWPRQRDAWVSSFEDLARDASSKSGDQKKRVRDLRKELVDMQKLGDGPMKEALKKRGMPALNELRKLLMPKVTDVIAMADEDAKKKHRNIRAFAGLRDAIIKALIIPNTKTSIAELEEAEQIATQEISGLDRKGLKVMAKNRKEAERKQLPESERIGVADANIMRLLAGLSALAIDTKLCEAGRDHSKDMATLKFFAHESPVKGKKSPSDRAKNFGTSGGGENIFAGNPSPQAANKAWFYSPGHHRNMFRPNYRTIGMGNYNRHWTQMFN